MQGMLFSNAIVWKRMRLAHWLTVLMALKRSTAPGVGAARYDQATDRISKAVQRHDRLGCEAAQQRGVAAVLEVARKVPGGPAAGRECEAPADQPVGELEPAVLPLRPGSKCHRRGRRRHEPVVARGGR